MSQLPPVVEVVGVAKRFGGAQALADVSLQIRSGEIHGLVGENGAGKSTLGKIIAGGVTADEGQLRVDGEPIAFRAPRDALRHGIAIVEQELALVPAMSVLENVLLGFTPQQRHGSPISTRSSASQWTSMPKSSA
jgi:ABC-type sugar transport system ATPase subunit